MSTKLFIDFDGVYQNEKPCKDVFVITNKYISEFTINVNSDRSIRNKALEEFEHYCTELSSHKLFRNFEIDKNKVYLFNNFFFPLSQWLNEINKLLITNKININSKVEFSSFSNNLNVFLFEAEGERNRQFLYQSSYFLSSYILKYLQNKGFSKIHKGKNKTLQSYLSFYTRGPITLFAKTLQLLFYKLFVLKRNYNIVNSNFEKPLIAISSRGIIQTQFISDFYKKAQKNLIMFINEPSSKPFRNLKEAKKNITTFYYSEGLIKFKDLFREAYVVMKGYLRKGNNTANFMSIPVNFFKIIPENNIFQFHMKTYALSVNNAINKLGVKSYINKVVSFEMLSPFSYYLKVYTSLPVIQIQTTLMASQKSPNFIYSDKFYFYNKRTYEQMLQLDFLENNNIGYLQNIQYLGQAKQHQKKKITTITYFTQPIYQDEENDLIEFLKLYCAKYDKILQIKLHPRSEVPSINLKNTIIIDGILNSKDVISKTDLVITRTSSIGLDAWFANIPVVFFINGSYNERVGIFMPSDYSGVIEDQISIEEFNCKLPAIIDDFYNHSLHKELDFDFEEIKNELFKEL